MKEILSRDNEHIINSLGDDIEKIKGKRILITGSRGFLGQTIISLIEYLNESLASRDQVDLVSLDYDDWDICKPLDEHVSEGVVDYIINCAGIASPKKYLKSPLKTLDVSYIGTKNVLDFAMLRKTKSVLMFSSSEVYGTPEEGSIPTPESYVGSVTTFGNRSCYDIGKNVLETLCYVYHDSYSTPVNVLRPFNLYGPLMDFNDGRIVPNLCKSMITGKDFSIYGNGQQTRTYCYVADAVVYMLGVLLSGKSGEIYNIGSEDEEMTAAQIAQLSYSIIKPKGSKAVINPYPEEYPDQEPRRRCPNITKVKELTSYSPQYSFEDGFRSCYEFFSDRESE